jgi:hypothetical protein
MLAAVLNICTQEELNETAQESTSSVVVVDRDRAERRKVIKNKILAVGRISHMFSVLRYATVYCHRTAPLTFFSNSEEAERVSELKSISGSTRLPYGTLALGAEGIKNAIKSFDDACVPSLIFYPFVLAVLNIGLLVDANRISITSACPQLRSDRHRRHQPRPRPVLSAPARVPARMWAPAPAWARV